MAALLFRLALITVAFAVIEMSLGAVLVDGSLGDWALLGLGSALLIAGTAGFMRPMFATGQDRSRGVSDDA